MKRLTTMLLSVLLAVISYQATAAETNSISGRVYCDLNQNGTCDCEEGGLEKIHIQIFADRCGGTPLQTITSDREGNFTFHDFIPATYFIRADLKYVCGGRLPTTGTCREVELAAGEAVSLEPFSFSDYGQ